MHAGLTRSYKPYAPGGTAGRSLPLVVMLHGRAQDADDAAAGTAMNEQARAQGFLVLYPAQPNDAKPARLWNGFKLDRQQLDGGEPAMVTAMTRAVTQKHGVDARRASIAAMPIRRRADHRLSWRSRPDGSSAPWRAGDRGGAGQRRRGPSTIHIAPGCRAASGAGRVGLRAPEHPLHPPG
jgi:Esterase PHB depolymerase